MRKKSLVGIALAGIMAIGMCMPVMAAENTAEVGTNITYNVAEKYTVEIPATLTVVAGDNDIVFTGSDFLLEENASVTATLKEEVELSNGGKKKIKTTVSGVATLTTESGTQTITLTPSTTIPAAGKYTGTATFTVAYVGPTTTP